MKKLNDNMYNSGPLWVWPSSLVFLIGVHEVSKHSENTSKMIFCSKTKEIEMGWRTSTANIHPHNGGQAKKLAGQNMTTKKIKYTDSENGGYSFLLWKYRHLMV